jgi:hypothetical protein
VRSSAALSPGARHQEVADEEPVHEEVQEIREDVLVEEIEAERAQRRGGLARRQDEQQGAVAHRVE